jgi:hypothetical protein
LYHSTNVRLEGNKEEETGKEGSGALFFYRTASQDILPQVNWLILGTKGNQERKDGNK